ncbi:hypothetical protein TanjilG_18018 [Lupinus angustifolius]|uniref:Rhodanese domain-containing protein n=1 Tax=Lupinus angustifolius TaxID=3871 RepID=A0A1J7FX37_LUPAN|nr:hypothetical protein TanjilG_18018 [Lupinus angustifolius]
MKAIISTSYAVSTACFLAQLPFLSHTSTEASQNENLEAIKVPTSVPVRVAYELLLAGHKYLDVRTQEEFNAGHAIDAVNIPYMFKAGSGMTKNPDFVKEVSSHFRKDDEILVGCQLGKRSMMAANNLLAAVSNASSPPLLNIYAIVIVDWI